MNKKLVILGSAVLAVAASLFLTVSSQPPSTDCHLNCGFADSGRLYLTSLLPLLIATLGIWLLGVGIKR